MAGLTGIMEARRQGHHKAGGKQQTNWRCPLLRTHLELKLKQRALTQLGAGRPCLGMVAKEGSGKSLQEEREWPYTKQKCCKALYTGDRRVPTSESQHLAKKILMKIRDLRLTPDDARLCFMTLVVKMAWRCRNDRRTTAHREQHRDGPYCAGFMPRSYAAWEEGSNGPFNKRSRSITCHMENKTHIDFYLRHT